MLQLERFNVRILNKGDKYGREFCLTHDEDKPIVEFYDRRYPHTEFGQFVSRYYVSTLLEDPTGGLCLDGGNPNSWTVSADDMALVRAYLRAATDTPEPSPKVTKWELRITWSDGKTEGLVSHLPEYLYDELQLYFRELEDLREQDPEIYFMDNGV
jgi:hypothetical protein